MNSPKKIIISICISSIIILAYVSQIRTCIFYNIFHIPCIGCGLSRAVSSIMQGDILEAIKYNWLILVLIPAIIIVIIWNMIDIIKKQCTFKNFIQKNNKIIIILSIITAIIAWGINISNPLLY